MFIVEGADSFMTRLITHICDFLKKFKKKITQPKNMTQKSCSLVLSSPHLKLYSIKEVHKENSALCMHAHTQCLNFGKECYPQECLQKQCVRLCLSLSLSIASDTA